MRPVATPWVVDDLDLGPCGVAGARWRDFVGLVTGTAS